MKKILKKEEKTIIAKRNFERWNKRHYKIYGDKRTGAVLSLAEDEVFVPVYLYDEQRIDERIYISNYGQLVNFCGKKEEPYLYTQTLYKKYYKAGGKPWFIHKLVWFSFAYDAIIHAEKIPLVGDGILIKTVDDLAKYAKESKKYRVHHLYKVSTDNTLDGLQLIRDETHGGRKKDGLHEAKDNTKMDSLEIPDSVRVIPITNNALIIPPNDSAKYPDYCAVVGMSEIPEDFMNYVLRLNAGACAVEQARADGSMIESVEETVLSNGRVLQYNIGEV